MREDNPGCECTDNEDLVGGIFPFLRGYKMILNSTLYASLIRHLILYYDGRFECDQCLNHLLINQKMRYVAIITISRSGSSNNHI